MAVALFESSPVQSSLVAPVESVTGQIQFNSMRFFISFLF